MHACALKEAWLRWMGKARKELLLPSHVDFLRTDNVSWWTPGVLESSTQSPFPVHNPVYSYSSVPCSAPDLLGPTLFPPHSAVSSPPCTLRWLQSPSSPGLNRALPLTSIHWSLLPPKSSLSYLTCGLKPPFSLIFLIHLPGASRTWRPGIFIFPDTASACRPPSPDFPSSFFLLPFLPGSSALQKDSLLPLFTALFTVRF